MDHVVTLRSPQVHEHVRSSLAKGASLSRAVLEIHGGRDFSMMSILRTTLAEAEEVQWGHHFDWEPFRRWVVAQVLEHLSSATHSLVLVEDIVSKRNHPYLLKSQSKKIFLGSEVYLYLDYRDANDYAIETTLADAASVEPVNVFLTASEGSLVASSEVSERIVRAWAERTQACFVKAYDDEGYLGVDFGSGRLAPCVS